MTTPESRKIPNKRDILDLAAIREAAEKATPGPWYENWTSDAAFVLASSNPGMRLIAIRCIDIDVTSEQAISNACHIATMNPQTTLALLDELESLTVVFKSCNRARKAAEDEVEVLKQRESRLLKQNHDLANAGFNKVMTDAVQNTIADLTATVEKQRGELDRMKDDSPAFESIEEFEDHLGRPLTSEESRCWGWFRVTRRQLGLIRDQKEQEADNERS